MNLNYLLNQSNRLIILLAFVLGVTAIPVLAQSRLITGTVSSKDDGQTLPGANIVVPGSNAGTQTDANGKFSLQVAAGITKLVVTSIGFATQEVSIQSRSTVNVTLSSDNRQLSEVRVVGYGTQTKAEFTGSAARINGDIIKEQPCRASIRGWQGGRLVSVSPSPMGCSTTRR